jgi:hypothetical protein
MTTYYGDIHSGCSISGSFTTVASTGAPTALTGAPAPFLVAYVLKPGDATGFLCTTSGLTFALSCGGISGFHTWSANTNAAPTTYACGRDVQLVLIGGTVGGTCVSGYVVASWSMNARSHLRPTIHGRTLDVTSTGAAGIDWANVENPTTAVALTCTTLYSAVKIVDRPIVDASSVVASVSGNVSGSVGSISGVTFPTNFGATHILSSGEVGINWARVANCGTVQAMVCTSTYRVNQVTDPSNIGSGSAPTASEIADEVQTRNVGVNWANVSNCGTVQNMTCTSVFSTRSVENAVPAVTAGVTVTTNNDKGGYALSVAGINCVTSALISEPEGVPSWPMSVCTALGILAALATNCLTMTSVRQSLCDRAGTRTIGSANITCTSEIVHRGSFS